MPTDSDIFLDTLRATFTAEAQEHVSTMSAALQSLQRGDRGGAGPEVEAMFRAAHSLKGAARAVDLGEVEAVCQTVEDVVARWHRQGDVPSAPVQAALHQILDTLAALLVGDPAGLGRPSALLAAHRRRLRQLADAGGVEPPSRPGLFAKPEPSSAPMRRPTQTSPPAPAAQSAGESLVRVPLARLEAQLRMAEEMLGAKLAGAQRLAEWQALSETLPPWLQGLQRLQVDVRRLRRHAPADPALARVLDFLDGADRALGPQARQIEAAARSARRTHEEAARQIDALMDGARELFALPFATVAAPFARLVRDLCRTQGKQAQLVLRGEGVELDRRVLQEIKDPLLHLLRNAVDHGVETGDERRAHGKPAVATLTLAAERTDDQKVCLTLSDDGRGLDAARLRQAAVDAGLLSSADATRLDEPAAHALVFLSGLSTAPAVTTVSGRGLGLAIVRSQAESLGGDAQVDSRPGQGTCFRITLPARWAAFRGVLVQAGGSLWVVPTASVVRVARVDADAVRPVEGRASIAAGGTTRALADLARLLGLAPRPQAERGQMVVVEQGGESLALAVDAVLDEREVLVKPLAWPLLRVRYIAAAAVLGSGELVPVLHVADLLRRARRAPAQAVWDLAQSPSPLRPAAARTILLAEDSITSRMLLKSILESAGHAVVTAVDGADAWAKLRAGAFALLVSDVEMPGLDGFDLTHRVRRDPRLATLPVVLVTALCTPGHAARGAEVGASATIAKGSFERNHLLETVARLL